MNKSIAVIKIQKVWRKYQSIPQCPRCGERRFDFCPQMNKCYECYKWKHYEYWCDIPEEHFMG